MQAETHLLHSEPLTHARNTKMCREALLCEDYSLNASELQSFYDLKSESNILFEQNERWDLITSLYSEYFGDPPKRSGFQGQYPQTDFRGGGILSLQLILRFVRRNRVLVTQMQKDKAGFFFAITAINIAFFMKKYFHLADFLVPAKDIEVYCNRRAFKNFCRILTSHSQAYPEIHQTLLRQFYTRLWLPASTKNNQTLLQFNSLFEELTEALKNCFEKHELSNIEEFKEVFRC